MKKISVLLCGIAMLLLSSVGAEALVMDFEDVPGTSSDYRKIANGYKEFNWNNFYASHKTFRPGSGHGTGAVSGDWAAYNGWGNKASITRSDEFLFTGAYFTSVFQSSSHILDINGFRNGEKLYSESIEINKNLPTLFEPKGWSFIDTLMFESRGGSERFVMDRFTVDEPFIPVPAPAAILLLGSGLIALMTQTRSRNMSRNNAANS
jgi:hypothetical protein